MAYFEELCPALSIG